MKRSLLLGLLILLGSFVSAGRLPVAAQVTPEHFAPKIIYGSSDTPLDRVLITRQTTTFRRGKPGQAYPDFKEATVHYPHISGIQDPILLDKVQSEVGLKRVIGSSLEELRQDFQETWWLSEIDYKVNYNENFLLDLTYLISGVGAYPSVYEKHLVVDLKTGQKLRSHNLFKREFLGTIANQVNQRMQPEIKQAIAKADQQQADIREYVQRSKFRIAQVDNFAISDQGITFFYDFDFPHVIKAFEPEGKYFFTYGELKRYIRPDGPIGQFGQ
jgi:hypothetical protein